MTRRPTSWLNRSILGIVLATFFSDFSHEMATAVLPLYIADLGLGPAALGVIEGLADFLVSLSKLGGGLVGHRVVRKRPLAALGYLTTGFATAAIGLVNGFGKVVALRSIAWVARGFRSPLRDSLLSDAVEPTHFGRAYGLERAGDMLGAVAGPLAAALFVFLGVNYRHVLLWTVLPGALAAGAMFFLVRSRTLERAEVAAYAARSKRPRFPRRFWGFVVGVLLFGLGDFSRTFLILLAANSMQAAHGPTTNPFFLAILLYAAHNFVAALVAYPIGHLADRMPKLNILLGGYILGVATNIVLALWGAHFAAVVVAIVMSGIYYSIEETLEKATAAAYVPAPLRSLGFGTLASANAMGDMVSSLYVGTLMQMGQPQVAFGLAAAFGAAGVAWLWRFSSRFTGEQP